VDMRAAYTQLSAWHVHGRYLPPARPFKFVYDAANITYKAMILGLVHIAALLNNKTPRHQATEWGVLNQSVNK